MLSKERHQTATRPHLPRGDAEDPIVEAKEYGSLIAKSEGLDLQLLGIGTNGHIGFNEPTSSLASRTRIKTLTASTREANMRYYKSIEETPRFAITMGIATILEARKCIIVATGEAKSTAVSQMIEGSIGADCPATALQLHPDATVALDPEAASELRLKEYYNLVHPGGLDVPFETNTRSPNF